MSPRVIGGSLGGRRLLAPRGSHTRPTADRVREALFSILGPIDGNAVLDLFAGTGALGIEALSRGAGSATFVDSSATATAAVRSNLAALELEAEVVQDDARGFLCNASTRERTYDLVFIDPPYRLAAGLGQELAQTLAAVLSPVARVVCESDRRAPPAWPLPQIDERRYGDTLISIYGSQ